MIWNIFQFIFVSLATYHSCYGQFPRDVKFFEYGEHIAGEQISYTYNGMIPQFKPSLEINVTSQVEWLRPDYTYLRVEYYNLMSEVKIDYDPAVQVLKFYVRFPFVATPLGILGYALPK